MSAWLPALPTLTSTYWLFGSCTSVHVIGVAARSTFVVKSCLLSMQQHSSRPNVPSAAQVLAALRLELFRTLLLQKVEFFDRHNTTELTSLLSVELDNVRSFVFGNVSRDRGLRAILEASGSVLVLFVLSWRLGPVLGLVIVSTAVTAALYRQQTKEVEKQNSRALSHMVGVADQAFAAIRTVRCGPSLPSHHSSIATISRPCHKLANDTLLVAWLPQTAECCTAVL